MSNYPDGAENDPSAPYNQKDPEMTEWEKGPLEKEPCDRCNQFAFLDDDNICESCFQPEQIEEDEDDYDDDFYEHDAINTNGSPL